MKILKYILIALATPFGLTACLEETFPTGSATANQVASSEEGLASMSRATAAFMQHLGYENASCGYGGLMIWRDIMLQDFTAAQTSDLSYDYYCWGFSSTTYLGNYQTQYDIWDFYYKLIQSTNLLAGLVNPGEATNEELAYLGNALVYRAMAYMDLTRLYEYKHTGVAELDAKAANIMKLTVPIVTEQTTEAEGRNNPRAPFYKMLLLSAKLF